MRGIDLLEDIGYIEDSLVQEAAIHEKAFAATRIHNWSKWTRWGSVAAGFAVLCIAAVVLRQNFGSYDATESATTTDKAAAIYTVEDSVAEYAAEEVMEQKAEAADEAGVGASDSTSTTDTSASASTTAVTEAKYDVVTEETEELQIIKDYSMEKEVDGEIANLEVSVCYAAPEKGEYFYFYELEETMKAYAGQPVQYYVTIDVFGNFTNAVGETVYEELTYSEAGSDEQTSQIIKEYERLLAEGYEVIIEEDELRGYFTEEELNTFAVNQEYGYAFRFTEDF